jgi:sigma-B regulation protein RsbU (phosphoserine phosphatase)
MSKLSDATLVRPRPARVGRRRAAPRHGSTQEAFRVARAVQQSLFPTAPRLVGFDLAGVCYPCEATGGDYFDFIPLRDGCVGIVIGDVCGHGFGSALLMASTRAYLRALARTYTDLSELLTVANRILAEDIGEDRFVTLSFAVLDPRKRSLVYASAGHPTGYVLDAAGGVKAWLESTSPPLGLLPDNDFPASGVLTLDPGDLVLFLTDGVTEAQAPDGTPFRCERALDIIRVYHRDSAQQIVTNLYHAVRAFSHNRPPRDDITAVVTKVGPVP